jgi:hypothetical protein
LSVIWAVGVVVSATRRSSRYLGSTPGLLKHFSMVITQQFRNEVLRTVQPKTYTTFPIIMSLIKRDNKKLITEISLKNETKNCAQWPILLGANFDQRESRCLSWFFFMVNFKKLLFLNSRMKMIFHGRTYYIFNINNNNVEITWRIHGGSLCE